MKRALSLVLWGMVGCGPGGDSSPALSVVPPSIRSSAEDSKAERLARAEALLERERYAEADAEFRGVLVQDDRNTRALVGLSRLAGRMEDGAASLRYISRAAALQPQDGSIANQLGVAQVACGLRQEASKTFERAARLSPKDPLILLNSAQNRADLGDWVSAHEFASRAAELLPRDATPWLLLGRFEMRQERYPQAIPYLREASRRAPENAIVHYHLGKSLAASGHREEAREAFQIALKGQPPPEIRKEIKTLLSKP